MLLIRPAKFQIFEVITVDGKLPKAIAVLRVGKPNQFKSGYWVSVFASKGDIYFFEIDKYLTFLTGS